MGLGLLTSDVLQRAGGGENGGLLCSPAKRPAGRPPASRPLHAIPSPWGWPSRYRSPHPTGTCFRGLVFMGRMFPSPHSASQLPTSRSLGRPGASTLPTYLQRFSVQHSSHESGKDCKPRGPPQTPRPWVTPASSAARLGPAQTDSATLSRASSLLSTRPPSRGTRVPPRHPRPHLPNFPCWEWSSAGGPVPCSPQHPRGGPGREGGGPEGQGTPSRRGRLKPVLRSMPICCQARTGLAETLAFTPAGEKPPRASMRFQAANPHVSFAPFPAPLPPTLACLSVAQTPHLRGSSDSELEKSYALT